MNLISLSESSNIFRIGSVEINLEAYSTSPGFCGYVEYPENASADSIADEVIKQGGEFGPCSVIVSLAHIDEGEIETPQAKLLLNKLVSAGWVRSFSAAKWDQLAKEVSADPRSDDFRNNVLNHDFRTFDFASSTDNDQLAQLFAFVIALRSWSFLLVGHIFIFWKTKGLVVYPHEDKGVGCIAALKDTDLGKKFIKSLTIS